MPPKLTEAVATKKAGTTPWSESTLAKTWMAANQTRLAKRKRAESIVDADEACPKRAKGDVEVIEALGASIAQSEPELPCKLDEDTKERLMSLWELLDYSEHNKRSMGAIMDAIAFEDIRQDSVEDMIEAVLGLLKTRALSGEGIWRDLEAIERINIKHGYGEYDAEPVELSEEVQDRLDVIDGMVGVLSKTFLKDVNIGIGNWGNGTNSEMAADIVETLGSRARDEGSDLLDEYKVIKSVYRSCWGGCGGSSDEEEEGEEEEEEEEEEEGEEEEEEGEEEGEQEVEQEW
ncbi:hypothetical protein DFP72DRAFT_1070666 [Ephemerocybe angulata]|uniref:Uncharacterized protein n=1 Tax=Ephemerocybe angulata TaxID=980116 RepID=A0A8H6HTB6_9AGAR|nr:hypothetical protein DFP72DRAFT_1070666 [Tulosesus angulatus]